jgi:hypothetical protein
MIPRDVWVSEEGLEFCGVGCEELYRSYWVPRRGARPPAGRARPSGMNRVEAPTAGSSP